MRTLISFLVGFITAAILTSGIADAQVRRTAVMLYGSNSGVPVPITVNSSGYLNVVAH